MENKLKRNPAVSWRLEKEKICQINKTKEEGMLKDLDEGVVFINLKNEMFELNLLGAEIWLLCNGERTKKDIIKVLFKKYKIPREELEHDVNDFLSKMKNLHLII